MKIDVNDLKMVFKFSVLNTKAPFSNDLTFKFERISAVGIRKFADFIFEH